MLTILNDPAGITGLQRFELHDGETLQEQIARRMPKGAGGCRLLIDGVEVDPLTDRRLDAPPRPGMLVTVEQRPEGVETFVLVASLVLAAYTYSLIPRNPGAQSAAAESPNNSLTAQTNIARAYQAIPDVYGYRRVWPDLIQPSRVEYLNNVKVITEWLCVSRGKGTMSAVQYADTPFTDIEGAGSVAFEPASSPSAYPELNDTTLLDVFEPFETPDVNGQELQTGTPTALTCFGPVDAGTPTIFNAAADTFTVFTANSAALDALKSLAGTGSAVVQVPGSLSSAEPIDGTYPFLSYTVDGPNVFLVFDYGASFTGGTEYPGEYTSITPVGTSSVRGPFTLPVECDTIQWNVTFPRGLKGTVEVEVSWWQFDAGGEIPGTRETVAIDYTADSFNQQSFSETRTPSAGLGNYRIQFERTTPDLGNGADVAKLETLYAIRYYASKVLPGVTVIKVTTKATQQAIGFRERKFNLRWLRHVRTLSSTTISESRNFARAMAHLWCVAGEDLAELDTTALAAVNTAIGETSPMLRFDGSLDDSDMSLGERLQVIANAARCVVWRDGTKWTITRDQLRTTPELQLDYRNLARGGESAISYAAHLPASFDGVELEYVDEATQQQRATVRLTIASGAVAVGTSSRPQKIKLTGCATALQATNRAHLEARKLLYQRTSVKDTALADAAALGVGALVRWVDPNDFAGDDDLQAGEITAVNGTTVTTSEALDWKSESSGRMLITGDDGYYTGTPIVVTPATGGAVLASAPAGLYVRDDTRQLGSRYSFAVGLTEAEMEAAGLYLVTEIRPGQDRTVSLAMVNYDARVYAFDGSAPVGMAVERDYAFALSSPQINVGMAVETDTAFALQPFVMTAQETDTALALGQASKWNSADKDADMALSAGDTVATLVSTGTEGGVVRSVQGRSASDDHFAAMTYTGPDARCIAGIAKSTASLTDFPGQDADGYGYAGSNGFLYNSGSGSSYGATFASGAIVGVRLNAGALTFYLWSGSAWVSQGTAATSLTGTWYLAWGPGSTASGTRAVSLAGMAPPSGSVAWG